jgi:hypothetical protein
MYTNDWTWQIIKNAMNPNCSQLISLIDNCNYFYQKWYALTYGLTDAQILALPECTGMVAADVTALKYAMSTFNDLYNALHGGAAISQVNRTGYLTPFI